MLSVKVHLRNGSSLLASVEVASGTPVAGIGKALLEMYADDLRERPEFIVVGDSLVQLDAIEAIEPLY